MKTAPLSQPQLIRRAPPKSVAFLLFLFGAGQFFVDPEPGVPEFIFPFLLLMLNWRAISAPSHVLLLAGNVAALVTEWFVFQSVTWSLVSIYMTVISMALLSVLRRWDTFAGIRAFLLGGAAGAGATLAVLATPLAQEAYRYGIRFTGFFKDPNVTAPTALFFGVAIFALRGRDRLWSLLPLAVFAMAISRATYLAAAVGIVFALAFRNRIVAVFGAIALAIGALFYDRILFVFDALFASVGRQGIVNGYDSDRSSNWQELVQLSFRDIVPLGPGFSEVNGMSTHSTYIRLLVEQGAIVLVAFVIAFWIALRRCRSLAIKTALLCMLVNGAVIDATHWRVLFVALALALAWDWRGASTASPATLRPVRPSRSRRYAADE